MLQEVPEHLVLENSFVRESMQSGIFVLYKVGLTAMVRL